MFMENLPKKGPLSREFWAQKPTHMVDGTYPYPKHVMYPPGGQLGNSQSRPPTNSICRIVGSSEKWRRSSGQVDTVISHALSGLTVKRFQNIV